MVIDSDEKITENPSTASLISAQCECGLFCTVASCRVSEGSVRKHPMMIN